MENLENQVEKVRLICKKAYPDHSFLHIWGWSVGCVECYLINIRFLHSFRKFLLIKQSDYSPEFIYPMMNFVLNLVFQSLIVLMGNKFSYKFLILVGMIISTIALCILPIVVYYISGLTGFLLTCFIILFQGFANAIVLSGFYGIASFLPVKYVIAFSTGQGLAGILMNVIRYIVILSFGDSEDDVTITLGAIVFFAIAALIVLINIYFLNVVYKDTYFISRLAKSGEFNTDVLKSYNLLVENEKINSETGSRCEKDGNKDFSKIFKLTMDLCFLIFLNFLLTFIVFPAVSIQGKLFNLSPALKVNTLMITFNIGDTIGRYGASFLKLDKSKIAILVFLRFLFLITFTFISIANTVSFLQFLSNSFFVLINMALFAATNGYVASQIFTIAPARVPDELKGKTGSTMSLFLIIGIFSGSLYALFIIKNLI